MKDIFEKIKTLTIDELKELHADIQALYQRMTGETPAIVPSEVSTPEVTEDQVKHE